MNQAWLNRMMLPAAIVWTALMIVGSSIPSIPKEVAPLFHYDKILHFIEYAGFSWLWGSVVRARFPGLLPGRTWLIIVLTGMIWAALDEQYQGTIGRSKDLLDWVADSIGIYVAQAIQEHRARKGRGGENIGAI